MTQHYLCSKILSIHKREKGLSSAKMKNLYPYDESKQPLNANTVVSSVADMNIGSTTCKYSPSFSNFTNSYNNLAPVVAF